MKKQAAVMGLALAMAVTGITGCQSGDGVASTELKQEASAQVHKIGIASYGTDDDEVKMFQNYYKNYLEEAFPVEFVYSPAIMDYDDEKEFVDSAKKAGCEGIISFVSYDLSGIVDYCGDDMYYMLGSGTRTEDEFDAVKNKENFLGIIGPSIEDEYAVGSEMIKSLSKENGSMKQYVLLSGGSADGNFMHRERLTAMLDTLVSDQHFTLEKTVDELADAKEVTLAGTSTDGGKVYIAPGYLSEETKAEFFENVFAKTGSVDVVASTFYAAPLLDEIAKQENAQNSDIKTGAVDCFCETNKEAFAEEDAFGNSQLDFIGGKCSAMAAPSFVAMYNAVTGHADAVRENGEAFWLNQNFWYASSEEEYMALSDAADNVYENVYGTKDIMAVLKDYTDDAAYDDYKAFVEVLEKGAL